MKKLILLFLLIPSLCFAWEPLELAWMNVTTVGGGVPAAASNECDGFLICENFEGAGAPSGWTAINETGTIDYDYTTTNLRGAQSLYLIRSGWPGVSVYKAFTAGSTIYAFVRARWASDFGDEQEIVRIADASNNSLARVSVRSGGSTFRLYHGTAYDNGPTPTAGTTYFIWVRYTAGTGENGVAELHVSTTITKPASADVSLSTGTATADADRIQFKSSESENIAQIYDQVLVDDAVIGRVAE